MTFKFHKLFKCLLAAALFITHAASAGADVIKTSYFGTSSQAYAFCYDGNIDCIEITGNSSTGYTVSWKEAEGSSNGPRRGKGGDGDGEEFGGS